jgi:hypothetical protein
MKIKLNHTEELARDFLISQKNYSPAQIRRGGAGEPDFCCADGNRFEVKCLSSRILAFTEAQISEFKPSDTILVYKRGELVDEFLWGERTKKTYRIFTCETKIGMTSLKVHVEVALRLQRQRLTLNETYEDTIIRLLKQTEKK